MGHKGDLIPKIRNSLISLQRLLAFNLSQASERKPGKAIDHRIRTPAVDVQALRDHASFLTQKISFLLDATLGMISIRQTAIIKIPSFAAVVCLPPTLIACMYGINYEHMPELDRAYGYPLALALMVMSAVLPCLFSNGAARSETYSARNSRSGTSDCAGSSSIGTWPRALKATRRLSGSSLV